MADRTATVEITAHSRGLAAKLREARGKFSAFIGEQRKAFGKMAGGAMSSFAGNFASGIAGRGLDFVIEGAKGQAEFNDQLTRFGIAASRSPEQLAALSESVRKVSDEVAIGRNELLTGAQAYVSLTGDAQGAAAGVRTFGRVAQASGSNVQDIAETAASLSTNLGILPDQFEAAFSTLITQGKEGSVELKDLASQLSSLAPMTTMFAGGSGTAGLAETGSHLQIIRKGFGSASEAVTGYRALMSSLIKPNEKLKKANLDLYVKDPKTGVKTMKNFHEIVTLISNSKLMSDPGALADALGSTEALRAFQQLKENAGLYDQLIAKSKDATVVQRDLQRYMDSDAGKVKKAWQEAKNTLADAFTPERIQSFTNALVVAGQAMAKLVGWMSDAAGIVEKVAQGAALLAGGERPQTMDEQAADAREKYENERRAKLFVRGLRGEKGVERIAQEDELARKMERPIEFWQAQADHSNMSLKSYLATQREGIKKAGATNETVLLQRNAVLMGKAMAYEITKHLQPVEVKVGEDTVVKADRAAPNHRRRPGG